MPTYPITLATAYTDLAARLYDPTNQFWTQVELLLYLQEAMREWNALTGYWRGDFLLTPSQGTTWYDITNVAVAPNTLRPLTLTQTNLLTLLEYHLLEPPVGSGPWTGSAQFTLAQLQAAIVRRQQELLGATGCSLTQSLIAAAPGRTALPTTTLDLRRVAFLPAAGQGSPQTLWPEDSWSWGAFEPDYTTLPAGVPSTYALSTQPVFTFDVDVRLNVPGQYELLTTQAGVPPSLTVPDDWAWVLKWGALADLLGTESNAKDMSRAKYAEARYRDGMDLLGMAPALLGFRINNIPVEIDSVRSADLYHPSWEGVAQGAPTAIYVAGLNLLALSPPPDAGPYSLTLTVIENAPVPSAPTDPIPVTEDVYEALIDEAQHVAMFKSGGAEFAATVPLHQRFLAVAALYASKVAEMGEFARMLYAQSQQEAALNPRMTENTVGEAAGSNG